MSCPIRLRLSLPRLWFAGYARSLSLEVEVADGPGVQDVRIEFSGMGARGEATRDHLPRGQVWRDYEALSVVPKSRGEWPLQVKVSCKRGGMVRENYLWGGTVRVRDEPKNRAELKLEMNQGDLSVAEKAYFGAMFQGEARFGHQNQVVLGDGAFRNDLESLLDEIDERIEPSLLPLEFENHEPLAFVNSLGMAMIGVMPGHFHQGSPEMEEGRDPFHSDEQLREVWLTRPFWLARFPVTQSVWCELMGEGGCRHEAFRGDRIPAQGMSWHAAMEFCRILTGREADTGRLPAGHEYRLPTEAEWEYACRAGSDCTRSRYDPPELCAVTAESKSGPREVGERTANAWGFHDMLGNVFEWCLDAYAPYRFDQPADPYHDGDGKGERVIRGGCFQTPASFARFAARCHVDPSTESGRIGFRVALAPKSWPAVGSSIHP